MEPLPGARPSKAGATGMDPYNSCSGWALGLEGLRDSAKRSHPGSQTVLSKKKQAKDREAASKDRGTWGRSKHICSLEVGRGRSWEGYPEEVTGEQSPA